MTINDAPAEAQRYFAIAVEIRKSTEAILKKYGLNWKSYDALEHEAETWMKDSNADTVECEKFTALLMRKPLYAHKNPVVIGETNYIKLTSTH